VLDVATALHRVIPGDARALVDDVLPRAAELRRAFGRRASMPSLRFGGAPELAIEYARAFALTELISYQRAMRAIAEHRAELERVVDVVGEIDAALSIAWLRASDRDLSEATFDADAIGIDARGLQHPLVEDAVGNDLELGSAGLLITGSNMAGKSTMLRAIGVNAVLAQSIGLVAAERWRSRPVRVSTAMAVREDLAAGVSLYRAEVDRIHALVRRAGGDNLFLVDEAFRGTNPQERIAASAAVLRYLHERDLVVAATHDRELCDLLAGAFVFGFFTEQVEGDDVAFDYRLHPGVLQTTNAIAILERTGFPPELVAQARRLAQPRQ
jgi:DNA mismatch repair ATPase MutS